MNVTNITLENLGTVNKNCVGIATDKGRIDLYFSYQTIVGIVFKGERFVIENQWSTTTGKLLNELEPDKKLRLNEEDFKAKLASIFA